MKKIVASILIGLFLSLSFVTYSSAAMAQNVKEEVLRLHILANSDSDFDQNLKLEVRNEILKKAEKLFKNSQNKEETIEIALYNLNEFKKIAERVIKEKGCNYTVKVSVAQSFFPTKEYESGYRLPAGFYDSLKIEIGEAKGQNWWCILYPPLCFSGALPKSDAKDILNEEGLEFVSTDTDMEMEVKFKVAQWWGQLMNNLSKLS